MRPSRRKTAAPDRRRGRQPNPQDFAAGDRQPRNLDYKTNRIEFDGCTFLSAVPRPPLRQRAVI